MPWQVLIGNVAAVSLVISVWMHLHYKLYRLSKVQAKLGFGLMMGLGAVLSMILSVEIDSGYYLDLRSTLLAVSAVYGGPLAVLVTGAFTLCSGSPWAAPVSSRRQNWSVLRTRRFTRQRSMVVTALRPPRIKQGRLELENTSDTSRRRRTTHVFG
ncbi:LytS/YhcK type 5TM receptor domain-containing protein [Rhizobium leguminosarum]|uniref:LytS/YhcK type 5TM receptor domain-containing protein n=2 Tax=Rhizobium TaxID=379 RepID=UPI001FEF97BE|nr:LytS/YhcK type 5TM receptor domain-containing protein [Rhizobium leguminosarum]